MPDPTEEEDYPVKMEFYFQSEQHRNDFMEGLRYSFGEAHCVVDYVAHKDDDKFEMVTIDPLYGDQFHM